MGKVPKTAFEPDMANRCWCPRRLVKTGPIYFCSRKDGHRGQHHIYDRGRKIFSWTDYAWFLRNKKAGDSAERLVKLLR